MGPDDLPPMAVVVPDDIRELDHEVAAYHREQRRAARRTRIHRLLLTRRWAKYGLSGPIVVIVLVLVAFVGSLMALFPPAPPKPAPKAPLAVSAVEPGKVGGLLPDLRLQIGDHVVGSRSLRPALVYVVPANCSCAAVLKSLAQQTAQYSLQLILVVHDLSNREIRQLREQSVGHGRVAVDELGSFETTYGSEALAFVRSDGVVTQLVHQPKADGRYELPLSQLSTAHPSGTEVSLRTQLRTNGAAESRRA